MSEANARHLFTPSELAKIEKTLRELFGGNLRDDENIAFAGGLEEGHVHVVARLFNAERTSVRSFEAAVPVNDTDAADMVAKRVLGIEFLHAIMHEFFRESRAQPVQLDWIEHRFDGVDLRYRQTNVNEAVESMADDFLRAQGIDPASLNVGEALDPALEAEDDA